MNSSEPTQRARLRYTKEQQQQQQQQQQQEKRMEFAEVHDHPDNPGEYLTEDELKAYLEEKESQAQKARQEEEQKTAKEKSDDQDIHDRQAKIDQSLNPLIAHPASGSSSKNQASSCGGITDSNPWREDVEDRGLSSLEVHPGAYRVVKKNSARATKLKELGNARYKNQDYFESIRYYGQALAYCPTDETHAHLRAVCYSNRGACYMALGKYRRVVEETSMAIELDPRYVRALMRRAKAYELMDRLEDAVEDLNAAVDVDKTYVPALQEQRRVNTLYKEKTEKMKEEMLSKLKGFGNTILGKFGMSLDNFKLKPQEGGGYSVSYENN